MSGRLLLLLLAALRGIQIHMGVLWQPFALSLGTPMRVIGGFESLRDLISYSAQPFLGRASDSKGRRLFLFLRELSLVLALSCFLLAASWELLLLGFIFIGLSMAAEPVWSSLVAESSGAGGLGRTYSYVSASYMAMGLFAPLGAGFIASIYGYRQAFLISIIVGLTALYIIARYYREEQRPRGDQKRSNFRILPPPHLRGFYVAMAVDAFSFGLGSRILFGMLSKSYGYSPSMLGLMASFMTASWAVSAIPIGRVVDKAGYRRLMIISQVISCALLSGILISKRLEFLLLVHLLWGVSAALWVPAEQAWIAARSEPGGLGLSIGTYMASRGLIAFPAPFIGGLLYDAFGFDIPVLINLAGAAVDVILIATLIEEGGREPE
ncbi:MAG: MFS transporter [Candidatus Bathyarchaeia archaeon]